MAGDRNLSRRQFLQSSSAITGAAALRIGTPALLAITQAACSAKQESAPFVALTADEASDFAAIAARIIPTTDTPGATEAGVIYFIDNAFAAEMSAQLSTARAGLAEFRAKLADAYPDAKQFSDLPVDDQDAYLMTVQDGPLFGLLRVMTIFGMFAMSKYGGNKNNIGWQLLNFDGAHGGWQYPFGHYDAEVHGGSDHGE